jgi:carbonic anhydrase
VTHRNVAQVVRDIRASSGVLDRLIREGRIGIVGMVYDVSTGATRVVPGTAANVPVDAADISPTEQTA